MAKPVIAQIFVVVADVLLPQSALGGSLIPPLGLGPAPVVSSPAGVSQAELGLFSEASSICCCCLHDLIPPSLSVTAKVEWIRSGQDPRMPWVFANPALSTVSTVLTSRDDFCVYLWHTAQNLVCFRKAFCQIVQVRFTLVYSSLCFLEFVIKPFAEFINFNELHRYSPYITPGCRSGAARCQCWMQTRRYQQCQTSDAEGCR